MSEMMPTKEDNRTKPLQIRRTAKAVSRKALMAKGLFLTAGGLVLLMAILFAASALLSFEGAFTIQTLNPTLENKAVSLSETVGFSNPVVKLSASAIDDMDNITYEWLPFEELDARDGSHNGENYIDYTYYIRNSGEETLDYLTEINITRRTLAVEEAVRVMVYRNGEPTIYAHKAADGKTEAYPEGIVDFCGEDKVMSQTIEGLAPGQADRWTVVVWLEGEDPECNNNVLGGALRMEMDFTILTDDGQVPEDLAV